MGTLRERQVECLPALQVRREAIKGIPHTV